MKKRILYILPLLILVVAMMARNTDPQRLYTAFGLGDTMVVAPSKPAFTPSAKRDSSVILPAAAASEAPIIPMLVNMSHAQLSTANASAQVAIPTITTCAAQRLASRELVLSLDFGDNYELGSTADLQCTVTLKVELQDAGGVVLASPTWSVDLQTALGRPEEQLRINMLTLPSNAFNVQLKVINYQPPVGTEIRSKLRLRSWVDQDRRIGATSTAQPAQALLTLGEPNLTLYPPLLSWTTTCANLPNYELQLLRLHNLTSPPPLVPEPRTIQTKIDWSQALSVETGTYLNIFSLFPAEGTGYYIWRVRPIGDYNDGGIANPANWGVWCGNTPPGDLVTVNASLDQQYVNIFFFQDPSDGKNRQYTRFFHEGDHNRTGVFEQMSFADGNTRVVQEQSRLESTTDVVVRQHVYDHMGRESFVSMGAPLKNTTGLTYIPNALTPTGVNKPYGPENFDTPTKLGTPDKVGGPVVKYYDENPNASISSTEGYPFSLTRYFNEPNQRPFEKSGPGLALRPGSGKATRYSYAPATDAELVRVFGDEAPAVNRVYKLITSSPDGVNQVTYYEGDRVIATCLSDGGTTPFLPLVEKGRTAFVLADTLRGRDNADHMESHSFTLQKLTAVNFSYFLKPATYTEACSQICEGCSLTAEIVVRDRKTNLEAMERKTFVIPPPACGAAPANFTQSWSKDLAAGSYVVEKRLFGTPPATGTLPQPDNKLKTWSASFETTLTTKMSVIQGFLALGQATKVYDRLKADGNLKTPDGSAYLVPIDNCLKLRIPILACDIPTCDANYDLEAYYKKYPDITASMLGAYSAPGALNTKARALATAGMPCDQIWGCWKATVESAGAISAMQADAADGHFDNWEWPATPPPPYTTDLAKEWLMCLGKEFATPQGVCAPLQNDAAAFKNCLTANAPQGVAPVTEAQVVAMKTKMEAECNSSCESHRSAFTQQVIASHIVKGYTANGVNQWRNTAGTILTMEQVNCMVEGLIADCKAGCGMTLVKTGNTMTGLQFVDEARFRGAMYQAVELSLDAACPVGYRSVSGTSRQVPVVTTAMIQSLNARLDAFREANIQGGTFNLGLGISKVCSTQVTTAVMFSYDIKFPFRRPSKQFFLLRNCQLIFRTEAMTGNTEQVVCANVCDAQSCGGLCYRWKALTSPTPAPTFTIVDCEAQLARDIRASIDAQLLQYKTATTQAVLNSYNASCKTGVNEYLTYNWSESNYHYTLYYYDRAGRLVKTVSPEGIDYLDPTLALVKTHKQHPNHSLVTEYAYNSLGQMIKQRNPDGGQTTFWYDAAGRMRFSQDDQQNSVGEYSFVKYDLLGRTIEGGVSKQLAGSFATQVDVATFPDRVQATEWTRTVYSDPAALTGGLGKPQRYLLNRVSYVQNSDISLIAYSYDPHGNVEWIQTQMDGLTAKTMEFSYDLVSNKVTEIVLNGNAQNPLEQFRQRIVYDADNRPIKLMTSREGMIWENEASMQYYAHGPLKRTEIGEDKLQGLDYAYTTLGKIKAMNTHNLSNDPGLDGNILTINAFGADAFGYQVDYYAGDFVKTGGYISPLVLSGKRDYYSGLIAGMASETKTLTGMSRSQVAETYRYDIVGRLDSTRMYNRSGNAFTATPDFTTGYQYDGNGNLTSLTRFGAAGQKIDALTYNYDAPNGKRTDNRLRHVDDAVLASPVPGDLEDQAINNYAYDLRGRLTQDAGGEINSITWTANNKVRSIVKKDGTRIDYRYDPAGHRLVKTVTPPNGGTVQKQYYLTGADGNTVAIYRGGASGTPVLAEIPLGDGGKLGTYSPPTVSPGRSLAPGIKYAWRQLGTRQYALSDHLGNVRATIADAKEPVRSGTSPFPVTGYKPILTGATNYYAYGMAMPGQSVTGGYRYGYNGMERDNDVLGEGNEYTTEFREYDPRLGKWMSLDPEMGKFAGWSPYCAFMDSPTNLTDPRGDAPPMVRRTEYYTLTYNVVVPTTVQRIASSAAGKIVYEDVATTKIIATVTVDIALEETNDNPRGTPHYSWKVKQTAANVTSKEAGIAVAATAIASPAGLDAGNPSSLITIQIGITKGATTIQVAGGSKNTDEENDQANINGSVKGGFNVGVVKAEVTAGGGYSWGGKQVKEQSTGVTVGGTVEGSSEVFVERLRLITLDPGSTTPYPNEQFRHIVLKGQRTPFNSYQVRSNEDLLIKGLADPTLSTPYGGDETPERIRQRGQSQIPR